MSEAAFGKHIGPHKHFYAGLNNGHLHDREHRTQHQDASRNLDREINLVSPDSHRGERIGYRDATNTKWHQTERLTNLCVDYRESRARIDHARSELRRWNNLTSSLERFSPRCCRENDQVYSCVSVLVELAT